MKSPQCTWRRESRGKVPLRTRLGGRVSIVRIFSLLVLISFFASAILAQSTGGLECPDQLLGITSECSSTAQDATQMIQEAQSAFGASSANSGTNITEGLNNSGKSNYSGNRPGNYSDLEQWTRSGAAPQAPASSEPLTEFQKFVASSTGLNLPVYAADLFRRIPSTFAPLDMAPVLSGYVIGPGDELRIRLWGQVNFQANLRVDRTGEVYLPQVGQVHVAGLAFSALDAHLREAVGRIYRNFDLTADLGQIRAIQIYVSGQARRPGVYTVSALSTLVDALFASGGPSVEGSSRSIELRRNGALVTRFDLYDLLIRGDKSRDARLLPGDIIYIPPVGPQAALFGSVRNPAIYELLPQESLGAILADAGGVSAVAAEARVSFERIDEHRDRHAMEIAYDASGMAATLRDGDVIRVYPMMPKYQKTVTLRGNIANPGRFAWHEGMHVSDLIPDKESLLTRNYWWRRAQMGLPGPEFDSGQSTPPEDQAPSVPHGAGSTPLAGAQSSAPVQSQIPGQRTDVRLTAPEIDWDYAVIERLNHETLKTELLSFDLGRLVMKHDTSQDLELEPGDVVSIFSQADIRVPVAEETKLVRLEGEFVHAGIYSAQPGETLHHLVERTGGLTPGAYLYGSQFTREATRAVQQARIDEYVQSLSLAIEHNAVSLAASSAVSAQSLAGGIAVQGSEQDLLAGLRQIRATGRIVLAFHPDSSGESGIPDIALENGDSFVVPHVPATVFVVGAVNDQNSFLFKPGSRAETYLRHAGGPNRDADPRREFVIRADGEVVSRVMMKDPWGNEFSNLRIYPGDTIVVPEKMRKPSAMLGVMNWSQMFSQFALGTAALNLIY
jgi:protein involved in polysaccharide export with SLBB domain